MFRSNRLVIRSRPRTSNSCARCTTSRSRQRRRAKTLAAAAARYSRYLGSTRAPKPSRSSFHRPRAWHRVRCFSSRGTSRLQRSQSGAPVLHPRPRGPKERPRQRTSPRPTSDSRPTRQGILSEGACSSHLLTNTRKRASRRATVSPIQMPNPTLFRCACRARSQKV